MKTLKIFSLRNFLFDLLQGQHQEAQKSTNTYLPLNDASDIESPLKEGNTTDGAACPTRNCACTFVCRQTATIANKNILVK